MADKRLTIPENMGKGQEIALMYDFYQALPQDSYLKSILKQLPAYCEVQIQNDWGIDPIETISGLQRETSQTTKESEKAAKATVDEIAKLTRRAEWAEGVAKDIEAERDKLLEIRAELKKEIERLTNELNEQLDDCKIQRQGKEALEREIQVLKAKLYDYIIKERVLT